MSPPTQEGVLETETVSHSTQLLSAFSFLWPQSLGNMKEARAPSRKYLVPVPTCTQVIPYFGHAHALLLTHTADGSADVGRGRPGEECSAQENGALQPQNFPSPKP